jgi:hypothetical protein
MVDLFHNQFVPEAVKHQGDIRVRCSAPDRGPGQPARAHENRFEREFESEEIRRKWIPSAARAGPAARSRRR